MGNKSGGASTDAAAGRAAVCQSFNTCLSCSQCTVPPLSTQLCGTPPQCWLMTCFHSYLAGWQLKLSRHLKLIMFDSIQLQGISC